MLNDTTTDRTVADVVTRATTIPAVPRKFKEDAPEDSPVSLDADNTTAGAEKRARVRGTEKTSKNSVFSLLLLGGGASLKSLQNFALDDNINAQISKLTQAVNMAGKALGIGAALFGVQATLVGAGVVGDIKDTRAVAKAATQEATEKAVKVAAEEGTELAVKGGLKAAFSSVTEAGLKFSTKKIAFAGAFVTAAFAANEVHDFWSQGERTKAVAAGFVGAAETVGNLFTFGLLGDAFREIARQGAIMIGGEEFATIAKSDVRSLIEAGQDLKQQFSESAALPAVANLTPRPPAYNLALAHG